MGSNHKLRAFHTPLLWLARIIDFVIILPLTNIVNYGFLTNHIKTVCAGTVGRTIGTCNCQLGRFQSVSF